MLLKQPLLGRCRSGSCFASLVKIRPSCLAAVKSLLINGSYSASCSAYSAHKTACTCLSRHSFSAVLPPSSTCSRAFTTFKSLSRAKDKKIISASISSLNLDPRVGGINCFIPSRLHHCFAAELSQGSRHKPDFNYLIHLDHQIRFGTSEARVFHFNTPSSFRPATPRRVLVQTSCNLDLVPRSDKATRRFFSSSVTMQRRQHAASSPSPPATNLLSRFSMTSREPTSIKIPTSKITSRRHSFADDYSPRSSAGSLFRSGHSSDEEWPNTPVTEPAMDEDLDRVSSLPVAAIDYQDGRPRRASTSLISQNGDELQKLLGDGETGTKLIQKFCCGGGCCLSKATANLALVPVPNKPTIPLPNNAAFKSLELKLSDLSLDTELTSIAPVPEQTVSFVNIEGVRSRTKTPQYLLQPPSFVQPHPPYHVFSAPVYNARELTKPGAEKRTFHFDIDVTDYPDEGGVDFKVGGAIGICPPNDDDVVEDIFNCLGVPSYLRDKPMTVQTTGGRWPTIWGEDQARALTATRRDLLVWCCDLQSTPPTKQLLSVLAEYATDACEKKILTYLVSAEGQGAFCELRTGPHITIPQLLHAFPSSRPPLDLLISQLKQLMPRFYSLSNDPHISSTREGLSGRRLIEMAVTIHELQDYKTGSRTGVGSGYLERIANAFIKAKVDHPDATPNFHVPLFRGLMANPLSREFVTDGPMMLIGAGVGMAPFRGFILNRLKNANCANKIWLLQGVRDSSLDEIYSGELGHEEQKIKRVVQSRKVDRHAGEAKYVQEEVVHQADIVWFVVNAVDGRVFVCGSSQGMGEGVHESLVTVAMEKGRLDREQAEAFWAKKKEGGQYIAETW